MGPAQRPDRGQRQRAGRLGRGGAARDRRHAPVAGRAELPRHAQRDPRRRRGAGRRPPGADLERCSPAAAWATTRPPSTGPTRRRSRTSTRRPPPMRRRARSSGRVTDAVTGLPVSAVPVQVAGQPGLRTATASDGTYTLSLPAATYPKLVVPPTRRLRRRDCSPASRSPAARRRRATSRCGSTGRPPAPAGAIFDDNDPDPFAGCASQRAARPVARHGLVAVEPVVRPPRSPAADPDPAGDHPAARGDHGHRVRAWTRATRAATTRRRRRRTTGSRPPPDGTSVDRRCPGRSPPPTRTGSTSVKPAAPIAGVRFVRLTLLSPQTRRRRLRPGLHRLLGVRGLRRQAERAALGHAGRRPADGGDGPEREADRDVLRSGLGDHRLRLGPRRQRQRRPHRRRPRPPTRASPPPARAPSAVSAKDFRGGAGTASASVTVAAAAAAKPKVQDRRIRPAIGQGHGDLRQRLHAQGHAEGHRRSCGASWS